MSETENVKNSSPVWNAQHSQPHRFQVISASLTLIGVTFLAENSAQLLVSMDLKRPWFMEKVSAVKDLLAPSWHVG